ncbi:class I SAM-dependent methyltransferase [Streptomyces sp. So13.3]|nr:class I SAM-dependent methyltransferase [Streptomyces sp. So13.3]
MLNYDVEAERYDATRGGVPRAEAAARAVLQLVPDRARTLLDVGCGTGLVTERLARPGLRVLGVDASAGMASVAAGRVGPAVVLGDSRRLPFATGSVDAVCAIWLLHLLPDAAEVVAECARVLRPGGVFLTTVDKDLAHGVDSDIDALLAPHLIPDAYDEAAAVVGWAAGHGLRPGAETSFTGHGQGRSGGSCGGESWAGGLRSPPAGGLLREFVERRDDPLLRQALGDPQAHQGLGGGVLLVAEDAQQDVFRADVVVPEAQRLAQDEVQRLLAAGGDRHMALHRLGLPAGGADGGADRLGRRAQFDHGAAGQPFRLMEQAEDEVFGAQARVQRGARLLLGALDRVAGAVGEAAEEGVERQVEVVGGSRYEAFLYGLLADAHVLADVGPGGAGPAGLVHEVADQMVGDFADVLRQGHRVGEVLQRVAVRVPFLDVGDEVVESYWVSRHASTLG